MHRPTLLVLALAACGGSSRSSALPSNQTAPTTGVAAAGEATAVVFVMSGWEIWLGNDHNPQVAEDAPDRYPGALVGVLAAIDRTPLATVLGPGSVAGVVTFADKAVVRDAPEPVAQFTSGDFGTEPDYYSQQGRELVAGLALGLETLGKVPAKRHVLVVLSDGSDTNNEAARVSLPKLRAQADAAGVQVISIVYMSAMSDSQHVMSAFAPTFELANTADELTTKLSADLEALR